MCLIDFWRDYHLSDNAISFVAFCLCIQNIIYIVNIVSEIELVYLQNLRKADIFNKIFD